MEEQRFNYQHDNYVNESKELWDREDGQTFFEALCDTIETSSMCSDHVVSRCPVDGTIIDVIRFIKSVIRAHDNYMTEHRETTIVSPISIVKGAEIVILNFTNTENLYQDIRFLVTVHMKNMYKRKPSVPAVVEMLKQKLDLDLTVRADNQSTFEPNKVIFDKICFCFPIFVLELFHRKAVKSLASLNDLGLTDDVSTAVLSPFFASFIPQSFVILGDRSLHLLFFLRLIVSDNVRHKQDRNYTPLEILFNRYKRAYESPAVPPDFQLDYLEHFELISETTDEFIAPIGLAQRTAERKIRSLRPADVDLSKVIAELKLLK